ncbi:hypothetical protein ACFQ7O_26090 [Streptomyces sp. NPDC056485]|uniref:hypothetical protein n=1 Tax=Streptomyces sp. NPDC056485 TaxID=3345834 RepID=UPI00368F3F98
MWSTDSITAHLVGSGPTGGIWLARTGFALACLIKVLVESGREYRGYYQPTTYLYFRLRVRFLKHRDRLPTAAHYRLFLYARAVCAVLLLLGVAPGPAAAGLAVCFAFESFIYFKFHVNFFALLSACFVFAPTLPPLWDAAVAVTDGGMRAGWDVIDGSAGSRFCQSAVLLTVSALYIGSAYRKLNPTFLSGTAVWAVLGYTLSELPRRHHFDGWYPAPVRRWVGAVQPGDAVLRVPMAAVVVIEAALPFALLYPPAWPYAVAIGVAMHLAFTYLFPATLTAFSIATVSTYFAFLSLN